MDGNYEDGSPRRFIIICSNYPMAFDHDKTTAREYFRLFGQYRKLTFKPKNRICTVEYVNKEGMMNAFYHGGEFEGATFEITIDEPAQPKKKQRSKALPISKSNSMWVDKDEVQAELEAMSGIAPKRHGFPTIDLKDSKSQSSKTLKTPKFKRERIINKNVRAKSEKKADPKIEKIIRPKIKAKSLENLSSEQMELVNIILSRATTVEEKYRILDARDKLIRIKLKKQPKLKASPTIGTCPDMCPEKERLMRETQHQVALYEQETNGKYMDQAKAIKQYSRSSADQEAPLSHELRPVSVLQMTMGYLIHNIVNLCDSEDVNLAEWYHFLWDRTRGIRKDITQQELCSQGAVDLVEQCARFHIHCSSRLVAEDPSVFDQKINTENLTKCLQTLKYMYHDLRLKGEICPNEAEFRGYIILLNLNDGNFMWEVQQLHEDIQKSHEIKFAVDVYSSVDKNNYVKFFKQVRNTTYLNACILMRYFIQVRVTALKILLKCYSPRALKTVYPLDELVEVLAFDDKEAAIHFFRAYNLSVNDENTHIIIEKGMFISPETPYILERSLNIVETKRIYSTGRVICGKELPPKVYKTHIPQDSFDENGKFLADDVIEESVLEQAKQTLLENIADVSATDDLAIPIQDDTIGPSLSEAQQVKPLSNIFAKPVSNNNQNSPIFGIVSNPPVPQIQQTSIWDPSLQTSHGNIWNTPVTHSENIFKPTLPQPEVPFWKKQSENLGPRLENPSINIFSKSTPKIGGFKFDLPAQKSVPVDIPSQNIEVTVPIQPSIHPDEESRRRQEEQENLRCEFEWRLQEQERQKEAIKKKIDILEAARLRKEKLKEERILKIQQLKEAEIRETAAEILDRLVNDVEQLILNEKLQKIRQNIQNRIVHKLFRRWRNIIIRNKRKRKALDCNPMWINTKSLKESAAELYIPEQDLTLLLKRRYIRGEALDIDGLLDERIEMLNLRELTHQILSKRLLKLSGKLHKHIFWKVMVSLPDEKEMQQGLRKIKETLSEAFRWKEEDGRFLAVEHFTVNPAETITYSIEGYCGVATKQMNANGFIFIADTFNRMLQERVSKCLQNYNTNNKVPIVIILQSKELDSTYLKKLKADNILSNYIVFSENFLSNLLVNVIEDGLSFLASNIEMLPPLELDGLEACVEKCLCTEIWKRANSFAKWNSHYHSCLKDPNIVIHLYNEGLHRLLDVLAAEDTNGYASFPEEFKIFLPSRIPDCLPCYYHYFPKYWNNPQYRDALKNILNNLKMPEFDDSWPPKDELELEISMSNYLKKIFREPVKPFYRVMSVLLQNVDPCNNFENITDVTWTSVVEVLSLEKLKETEFHLLNTEFENESIFNQYTVVYKIDTMKSYLQSDWFYLTNPLIKQHVSECMESKKTINEHEHAVYLTTDEDIEDIINKASKQLESRSNSIKMLRELEHFNVLLSDLEASIQITRTISSRFEENLEKVIKED